ncbi:MAG: response regulator [Gemmatimonadaceae bacterium]|nr:response regulator [Gemmatimonadaceae bacterium]
MPSKSSSPSAALRRAALLADPRRPAALEAFRRVHGIPGTQLCKQMAEHGALLLRADAAIVALRDAAGITWCGAYACQEPTQRIHPDRTLVDTALLAGDPVFIDDAQQSTEGYEDVEALGWRSAAAMPLISHGVPVGALLIGRASGLPWGRREPRALSQWMTYEAVLGERRAGQQGAGTREGGDLERLQGELERLPLPILLMDGDGRIRFVNSALAALAQRSVQDCVGLPARALVQPELGESDAGLDDLRAGRRHGYSGNRRLRHADGSETRVRVVVTALRYADAGKHLYLKLVEDISAGDQVARAFRQREETLRLAQRREALSHLAGGLAHEFNNALAAISGLASLLSEDLPEADPRRGDADEILRVTLSASDLTRRLLDLTAERISERATFDLREVLRAFTAVARRVLPSTIDWNLELPPDRVAVTVDRPQFEQALLGLVLNARDAMPTGGHLTVSLSVLTRGEGEAVRVAITDSGPGIPASLMDRLWTPFFTTKPAGSGLGLAFALAVLREHGGDLLLESAADSPATFAMYLPVVQQEAPKAVSAPRPVTPEAKGGCVLLVEDDATVRTTTQRVLARAGFRVIEASDGPAALKLFEQHRDEIDAVVTDLQMPHMSGGELVARLRRHRANLPVVVTSAHPPEESDPRELRDEHTLRLRKPFTVATLVGTLREALDRGD